jgi:hypothetical protein
MTIKLTREEAREEFLAGCLQRMTGEHWEALEYVRDTRAEPVTEGAMEDLVQWGAIQRFGVFKARVTVFGRDILATLDK